MSPVPHKKLFKEAPSPQEVNDFIHAASGGHNSAVAAFLDKHPTAIDSKDERGGTALMRAAQFGHESTVRLLLDKGAAVGQVDNSGRHALSRAETAVIAEMLLKKGAEVDLEDDYGRTALVYAKSAVIVDVLLKNGAEIDRKGGSWTSLLWAAYDGREEVVIRLLEKGADINQRDEYGYDARLLASEGGHEKLLKLLEEWPEKQQQRALAEKEKERRQWLEDTDYSRGLKKPLRAPRPLRFKKGS